MNSVNYSDYEFNTYVDVNSREVEFTLDTGSQVTIITEQSSRDLKLELVPSERHIVGANSRPLEIVGDCEVELSNKCISVNALASIIVGSRRNLLGIIEIRKLNLLAIVRSLINVPSRFDPFVEFPKLFEGLGTMPDVFKINLKDNVEPYRIRAPRSIAAGLKEKAHQEILKMLELGVIEPVEEPTDWCSGLTIAPKAGGKIRMCVDLTRLNRGVKRELYPLPRVSDLMAKLAQGIIFSKVDANCGFWQVTLAEESREYTTFLTPWGRFQFVVMPFGISSAPEFYQRSMEKILYGLEGVICMMDDVLVFGKSESEHWVRLKLVLGRIQDAGMTLKREKCEFGVPEVKFLGHVVSMEGIKLDPDKAKAIFDLAPPTCLTEGRRLMGMVNYLNKFSKKLAEYGAPIYEVLGSPSRWYWGQDQADAFEKIKMELASAPVLCAFDVHKRHKVSSDASRIALGAVLMQFSDSNEWQPVEYASRKLTDTETRYAMIELEALAITYACEKFDYYLVGRKFDVETDHKPLISLLNEKDLSQLPLRVQRFKMRLMRYDFVVSYTPGSCMYIADFLSRPAQCSYVDKDILDCHSVELYVSHTIDNNLLSNFQQKQIIEAVNEDFTCIQVLDFIAEGWPSVCPNEHDTEMRRLFQLQDRLTAYGDIIMFDSRIYIPESLRSYYMALCHEGHQGITKCVKRARQYFWWPRCSQDISDYVTNCEVCIKGRAVKHQPAEETELPSGPWVELGSDVLEFQSQLYLLVVDYYSKWIELKKLSCQTAAAVIQAMKEIFSCFGSPSLLRADNGPCYISKKFESFALTWGFTLRTSSPHYHESNGLAERSVRTVKMLLSKSKDVESCLLVYRSTPLASGYSPAELMFGRPIKTKLGLPLVSDVDYEDFEKFTNEEYRVRREKWNKKHNAKYLPELIQDQRVWVKSPEDKGAVGIVVRKDKNPHSYWVKVGNSVVRRNRKHLYLLKSLSQSEDSSNTMSDTRPLAFESSDSEDSCNDVLPDISVEVNEPIILPDSNRSNPSAVNGNNSNSDVTGNNTSSRDIDVNLDVFDQNQSGNAGPSVQTPSQSTVVPTPKSTGTKNTAARKSLVPIADSRRNSPLSNARQRHTSYPGATPATVTTSRSGRPIKMKKDPNFIYPKIR